MLKWPNQGEKPVLIIRANQAPVNQLPKLTQIRAEVARILPMI